MNKLFLKQNFAFEKDADGSVKGILKGVAYTGAVIEEHGWLENLIVDVSTLKIAKEKTPLLRDHNLSLVAGHGKVTIDGVQILIDGLVSKKSSAGREILDLSEDDFEWQMSIGIFNGDYEEITNEEVNGIMIEHGTVVRNGLLREVSICALGADGDTSAEILNVKLKKETLMLTKDQWIKLACGCGGNKETTPEELETKFGEKEDKIKEAQAEIDKLKEQIASKQAEIDALKGKEELAARETELKSAIAAKGIEMSDDKITLAAKSKESTETLLSFIGDMKIDDSKKITAEMAEKLELGSKATIANDADDLRLKAEALVKEGKAKDFLTALDMLEVK